MASACRLVGVPPSGRVVAGEGCVLRVRCADAAGNPCRRDGAARATRAAALLRPVGHGHGGGGGVLVLGDGRAVTVDATPGGGGGGGGGMGGMGGGMGDSTAEATEADDGSLELRLAPTRAQTYEVSVTVDGARVPGGRFGLAVVAAAARAPCCALEPPHALGTRLLACARTTLRLRMRDAFSNAVLAAAHLPGRSASAVTNALFASGGGGGGGGGGDAGGGGRCSDGGGGGGGKDGGGGAGFAPMSARCSCCDDVRLETDPLDPSVCLVRLAVGATARATQLGRHWLHLLLGGEHVQGSPFLFEVVPGEPHAPQCVASGAGVHAAARMEPTLLVVTTHDALGHACLAGGADLAVSVAPCAHGHYGTVHELLDRRDGTYVASYSVPISGRYSLSVTIGGRHIGGSPFRLVVAGAEDPVAGLAAGSGSPASPRAASSPRLHTARVAASGGSGNPQLLLASSPRSPPVRGAPLRSPGTGGGARLQAWAA